MLRKTFFSLLLLFVSSLHAYSQDTHQIKDFDELMEVLKAGKTVNTVLHYAKCELYVDGEKSDRKIDAIGGMPIDVYEYFSKNLFGNPHAFVSSSQTKLIQNPKGKGYVYNYVKVRIYDNNQVDIIARYLHPKNYKEKMAEKFVGTINDGKNDGGVYLFKSN
jgi:hypothetical protein